MGDRLFVARPFRNHFENRAQNSSFDGDPSGAWRRETNQLQVLDNPNFSTARGSCF